MNYSNLKLNNDSYRQIALNSRTSYDRWIEPPSLEILRPIKKNQVKTFGNVRDDDVSSFILNKLKENDPLFKNLSPDIFKLLTLSIEFCFCSINRIDLSQGGSGMIIPTFIEIIHHFIFLIKEKNISLSKEDKKIYYKYLWAFEMRNELVNKYLNNKAS